MYLESAQVLIKTDQGNARGELEDAEGFTGSEAAVLGTW